MVRALDIADAMLTLSSALYYLEPFCCCDRLRAPKSVLLSEANNATVSETVATVATLPVSVSGEHGRFDLIRSTHQRLDVYSSPSTHQVSHSLHRSVLG